MSLGLTRGVLVGESQGLAAKAYSMLHCLSQAYS